MKHIPNLITALRVALTVPIVLLLLRGRREEALWIFLIAGLSDGVDGFLARRMKWGSLLGALLDPLADKLLLASVVLTLGLTGELPVWLVAVVFGRDALLVIAALAAYALKRLREFPPSLAGKLSTVLQIALVVAVLSGVPALAVHLLIWAVAVVTSAAGVHYFWRGLRAL